MIICSVNFLEARPEQSWTQRKMNELLAWLENHRMHVAIVVIFSLVSIYLFLDLFFGQSRDYFICSFCLCTALLQNTSSSKRMWDTEKSSVFGLVFRGVFSSYYHQVSQRIEYYFFI